MKVRSALLSILLLVSCMTTRAVGQDAVGQVRRPIWITLPTSAAVLQSIQAQAPATGNMVVMVTGSIDFFHTLGTMGNYCLQLSQTSGFVGGCVPDSGSDSAIRNYIAAGYPTTVSGLGQTESYSMIRVWPVTAGSTYTFYLNGYEGGFTTALLFQPSITALFVPGTLAP